MKKSVLMLAMVVAFVFGQTPAPDKVVARVNGSAITAKELEEFAKGLPPQFQQFYGQDKEGFLKQYAVLMKFSAIAEATGVDKQAPYKQRLQFMRLQTLAQALVEDYRNKIVVSDADLNAFYAKNKDNYTQAKLQVLLVNFAAAEAKPGETKKLTEAQAEAKAKDLVKQLKAGADFKKLVAENSDDVASKAKGGDFGTIRRSDQIPDELKMAIFALKQGEYSEPVKQPNGFYIFKVVEYTAQPFEEVKSALSTQAKDQKFQEWLKLTQDTADVKVEDPAFFGKTPPVPVAPPPVASPQNNQPSPGPSGAQKALAISFAGRMRAHRGKLCFGAGPGDEVFAASFLPRREVVLALELLDDAPALVEIFAHEIYHFVWRRLGNKDRTSWAELLEAEVRPRHLGLSSSLKFEKYMSNSTPRTWKEYSCEAFCDSAAALTRPASKISSRRKQWFARLMERRSLAV